MIDKDTLRIARRTAERNGYTVLPPRDRDEYRANDREEREPRFFSSRDRKERTYTPRERSSFDQRDREERDLDRFRSRREVNREETRTERPRYRDVVEEPRRFKPLCTREDDYEDRPARPVRREMNDDEKLGAAIRTAEENGYSIRKMTRLDQAKQVAKDHGFDVHKVEPEKKPTVDDRPVRRVATQNGEPIRKPALDREIVKSNADAVRTRTAPDVEIKPTQEDDYMKRAAAFFDEE